MRHNSHNTADDVSSLTCEEVEGDGEAGAEAGLLKNRLRLR